MKVTFIQMIRLLLIIQLFPHCLFGQDSLKTQTEVTKPINNLRAPRMIIKTDIGALWPKEGSVLTLDVEGPIGKKFSFENIVGYYYGGTYEYGEADAMLSSQSLNYRVSSGFKYYFKQSDSKQSWLFGMNLEYSNRSYHGSHLVADNWAYSNSWFFGGWYAKDQHVNTFELNVQTWGLNFLIGWQKVFFKRIPVEIGFGFGIKETKEDVENYESSTPAPSKAGYTFLGVYYPYAHKEVVTPSPLSGQFNLKIGYMIFKQTKQ